METIDILDVTVIEPRLKHPKIFEKFDQLMPTDCFVIHNDHDPKPLYYQLLGERGNIFSWEYLLSGPEIWEVKITKNGLGESSPTIGEIVAKDYRKAEVFKKYNLDFCCGGKKTVSEACNSKQVDVTEVEKELKEIDIHVTPSSHNFDEWNLDFLVDYIINTHHAYVKKSIPVLIDYTKKVESVHGNAHPEVITIAKKFHEVAIELIDHMEKEENILFPYIKKLVSGETNQVESHAGFGSIKNPIGKMEMEHELVGDLFEEIREMSSNYTPPEGACTTYKLSFLKLKEFEDDLHQHIHLENNILFPKSVLLENKF